MDFKLALLSSVVLSAVQTTAQTDFNATSDDLDQVILKGFGDLNENLTGLEKGVNDLRSGVTAKTPADAITINTALDFALSNLYKLAIFVRGDYDHRKADAAGKKKLMDTIMIPFQAVKQQSEDAFKHLSDAHAQASGLRSAELTNIKGQLEVLGKQLATRLSGLETAIKDGGDAIERFVESNRQAEENLNTLRNKKRSAENAALGADVGLGILTLGIWSIVGAVDPSKSPSAVIGLQNDIDTAQNSINSTITSITQARGRLVILNAQLASMQQAKTSQQEVSNGIPVVEAEVDHNLSIIDKMITALTQMKTIGLQLLERMSLLANAAELTTDSFLKKEFVSAILDACLIACIDMTRATAVRTIVDEVVTGTQGKPMNADLQKQLAAVIEKLNAIPKTSTIEEALKDVIKGI